MASLLGKADTTLVQGSFREAMADVPADMSGIYAKREKTLKEFTTAVNKIWDKQFEDYKAFETRIIDKSDQAITNALQGKTNTKLLKNVESEVFRIKEKMKTFDKRGKDKGNVEWRKLEEELNKLVITTSANAEAFNSLNEAITNNELHITGAPPKILELYEAMVDDYNNDTSFTNAKYVDGDQVYTHPDDPNVTMTFGELQKKLEGKNPKPAVDTQEVLNGVKKYAASSKRPLTARYIKDINNQLLKIMRTPNDRANVMYERFEGLDYSFFEALTGKDPVLQEQIYDALDAMGGIDIDGVPGKETRETYASPENAHKLQQAIINGPNSELIADFLTNNIVADNYQIGVSERQTDTDRDVNKIKYFPSNQNFKGITGGQLNSLINKLDSGTVSIGGVTYNSNPNNNSWVPVDGGDPITGNDMLMTLKNQHAGDDGYNFPTDQRFVKYQGTTTTETKLVTTKDKTTYTNEIQDYFKDLGILDQNMNFIKEEDVLTGDSRFADRGRGRGNFAAKINKILQDNEITNVEATTSALYPNSIKLDGIRYTFKTGDWDYNKFIKALDKIIMGDGKQQFAPPKK